MTLKKPSKFWTSVLIFLGIFLAFSSSSNAQEKKTIEKEFNLSPDGTVKLNNRYGNLKINHWDKEKVYLKIEIEVKGSNEERAKEILEQIHIEFETNPTLVSAKTKLNEVQNSWWRRWGLFKSSAYDFTINYTVNMPKSAEANFHNEYGTIFIDALDGKTLISCDYGRIDVGELNHPENIIQLEYTSRSTIDYIQNGDINLDYSSLDIEEALKLNVNADYSSTNIGMAKQINFDTDYGSFKIREVQEVEGNGDYVGIKIGSISKSLAVDLDYGSIHIASILPSTTQVEIDTDYAGIYLGAHPDWEYGFKIKTVYGRFSTDFPLEYNKKIIESNSKYYEGIHRENTNSLSVFSEYGGIKLIQN